MHKCLIRAAVSSCDSALLGCPLASAHLHTPSEHSNLHFPHSLIHAANDASARATRAQSTTQTESMRRHSKPSRRQLAAPEVTSKAACVQHTSRSQNVLMSGLGWGLHYCAHKRQACIVQHSCGEGRVAPSWRTKPARLSPWALPASHLRNASTHASMR